jgi:hypothetical protein
MIQNVTREYKFLWLHSCFGTKNGPSFEGPICLGSLWLGEFFASALFVADSANLVEGRPANRLKPPFGEGYCSGGALTPVV